MSENTTNVVIDGNDVKPFWNGYEIYGNPFDVIMEASIDYMRNSIFNVERYRNNDVPIKISEGNYLIERIKKQYEILDSMTDEEVELCRQKSILFKKLGNIMLITHGIFNFQQSFRTKYCECNPELDPEMEKLFFGEESSEYLRRKSLIDVVKEIYKKTYKFDEIDELLSGAMYALDPNVKKGELFEEQIGRYEKGEEFAKQYCIEMKDVEFMISVVKHMKDDQNHTTEKFFEKWFDEK